MTSLKISLNKQNKASILFAQYVIEACIDAVSNYLSININKFPSELLDPVKSFDEKLCICEKHQKYLCKNQILCRAVCNEMALDHITVQRIHQKKIEKVLISKSILFKKIITEPGKGEFSRIKGRFCNLLKEATNISNILPSQQFPMDYLWLN